MFTSPGDLIPPIFATRLASAAPIGAYTTDSARDFDRRLRNSGKGRGKSGVYDCGRDQPGGPDQSRRRGGSGQPAHHRCGISSKPGHVAAAGYGLTRAAVPNGSISRTSSPSAWQRPTATRPEWVDRDSSNPVRRVCLHQRNPAAIGAGRCRGPSRP